MTTESVVLGGGCFWCTEAIFTSLRGVISVTPGYAGGTLPHPTYDQVCSGTTGHAEVIKVDFDPAVIPFTDLLDIFLHTHDPTQLNRQGHDQGTQYRSIVLYTTPAQLAVINALIHPPMVTEIQPLADFYPAESYHKDYYAKNSTAPYCQLVISPKLASLRAQYSTKLNI